jgi:tetratricopeptide (TPR) repeat protein
MEGAEREAKLGEVTALLQRAIKGAETGDWANTSELLKQAESAFREVPEDRDPKRLGLAAAIEEGHGQVALRNNKAEDAIPRLEAALRLRAEEQAAGGTPPPLSVPVGLVNLTGALHRLGRVEDALNANLEARRHLEKLPLPPARFFLATSYEAGANLLSQLGRHSESMETFEKGLALARELTAQKLPGALQVRTELLVAAARAAGRAGMNEQALGFCAEAADVAWDRFEQNPKGDRDAMSHFVAAQMNLLGFAEACGRYAAGEDALFKVLRLIGPEPRVLERGLRYYEALKQLDDDKLSAGNLPRDEVEESHAQLIKISQMRPPAAAT